MGIFNDNDEELDEFDFMVLDDLDRMNRKSGGCVLGMLIMLAVPVLAMAGLLHLIQ